MARAGKKAKRLALARKKTLFFSLSLKLSLRSRLVLGSQVINWSKKIVGNKREEGEACKILSWSHRYLGKYEESIEFGNEVFRIAKEELDEDAVLDAYVVLASSYAKLTPEKRSKETRLDENASDSGIEERFSTLRFGAL